MKALSEELENPMNVHRWRKLEGSDPTTFEMIQKIHTLQKRLIAKTEEVRGFFFIPQCACVRAGRKRGGWRERG